MTLVSNNTFRGAILMCFITINCFRDLSLWNFPNLSVVSFIEQQPRILFMIWQTSHWPIGISSYGNNMYFLCYITLLNYLVKCGYF